MARLMALDSDGFRFSLSPDQAPSGGNRFSVIVGPNASGKSRLLAQIVKEVNSDRGRGLIEVTHSSVEQVLAISSLVTDSFPFVAAAGRGYRYLGIRQSSNTATTGSLRDLTGQAVALAMRDEWRANSVFAVLNLVGFTDLSVEFVVPKRRTRPDTYRFRESLEREYRAREDAGVLQSEQLVREVSGFSEGLGQTRPSSLGEAQQRVQFLVDLAERYDIDVHSLLRVAKRSGMFEIRLSVAGHDGWMRDLDLSTGQLLLISLVARVAAFLRPNSLVLIDEPETALHPAWQSELLPLLRGTVPTESTSHFFFATHSPYIVADGSDLLVPEGEWGCFEEFSDPFFGRSPENILYRAFGARVTGNSLVDEDLLLVTETLGAAQPPIDFSPVRAALRRLSRIAGPDTTSLNELIAQATDLLEVPHAEL